MRFGDKNQSLLDSNNDDEHKRSGKMWCSIAVKQSTLTARMFNKAANTFAARLI